MGKFIIEGGHRLSGRVKVQGAKNAALPVLAATVMSRGEMTLFNCPEIRDVHNMLSILRELGVEIECNTVIGKTLTVDDLFEMGYEALFIGSGAGLPLPHIP